MSPRRLERLAAHHDLSEFRSGNQSLDSWLRDHALASQQMDSARTFLLIDEIHILGYFSLTMGSVLRSEAPTLTRARATWLSHRYGPPRSAGCER